MLTFSHKLIIKMAKITLNEGTTKTRCTLKLIFKRIVMQNKIEVCENISNFLFHITNYEYLAF